MCTLSTVHIHRCSIPTAFAHLGPNLLGRVRMESPLWQHEGQSGCWTYSHAGPPWTGSEQWHTTHHQCACFLEGLYQMPIWGHQSGVWTSLNPIHPRSCIPSHPCKSRGVPPSPLSGPPHLKPIQSPSMEFSAVVRSPKSAQSLNHRSGLKGLRTADEAKLQLRQPKLIYRSSQPYSITGKWCTCNKGS